MTRPDPSLPENPPVTLVERRRSPRMATPELPVAIEKPTSTGLWLADAVDISAGGLGMVLSGEFPPGTEILLTFRLGRTLPFLWVPAVVLRQGLGLAGVKFHGWSETDLCRLDTYLRQHLVQLT